MANLLANLFPDDNSRATPHAGGRFNLAAREAVGHKRSERGKAHPATTTQAVGCRNWVVSLPCPMRDRVAAGMRREEPDAGHCPGGDAVGRAGGKQTEDAYHSDAVRGRLGGAANGAGFISFEHGVHHGNRADGSFQSTPTNDVERHVFQRGGKRNHAKHGSGCRRRSGRILNELDFLLKPRLQRAEMRPRLQPRLFLKTMARRPNTKIQLERCHDEGNQTAGHHQRATRAGVRGVDGFEAAQPVHWRTGENQFQARRDVQLLRRLHRGHQFGNQPARSHRAGVAFPNWPLETWSDITITLAPMPGGKTKLSFLQTGVPAKDYAAKNKGWRTHYWEPLKRYLEG